MGREERSPVVVVGRATAEIVLAVAARASSIGRGPVTRVARDSHNGTHEMNMQSPRKGWRAGRLMISPEPGAPERARVIGSLTGDTVHILLDAVDSGVAVLDLSEVDQADVSAVRVLARLSMERCTLLTCPRWLELWLSRAHASRGA